MKLINIIFEKYYLSKDPIKFARFLGVKVGNNCRFLGTSKATYGSEPYLITIGNHVTITSGVNFITHDGGVWVFREENPKIDVFGSITIGNNVFIGLKSIIMPNTTVGDNVVIGAGSLVRGNLESNYVYAGVPVRKIMTIEEYKQKSLKNADFIKGLSPEGKRAYLTKS